MSKTLISGVSFTRKRGSTVLLLQVCSTMARQAPSSASTSQRSSWSVLTQLAVGWALTLKPMTIRFCIYVHTPLLSISLSLSLSLTLSPLSLSLSVDCVKVACMCLELEINETKLVAIQYLVITVLHVHVCTYIQMAIHPSVHNHMVRLGCCHNIMRTVCSSIIFPHSSTGMH